MAIRPPKFRERFLTSSNTSWCSFESGESCSFNRQSLGQDRSYEYAGEKFTWLIGVKTPQFFYTVKKKFVAGQLTLQKIRRKFFPSQIF